MDDSIQLRYRGENFAASKPESSKVVFAESLTVAGALERHWTFSVKTFKLLK